MVIMMMDDVGDVCVRHQLDDDDNDDNGNDDDYGDDSDNEDVELL